MAKKTPSQEAKELIYKLYQQIGFYPQAKRCALVCVDEIINSLDKNRGFTQCAIDLEYYRFVRTHIEESLK